MQKNSKKFFFKGIGVIIFVLFIGILINYNVISINESNNQGATIKTNLYSPGLISSSVSEKLKGLIAIDRTSSYPFYGPFMKDQSSITCCQYTPWEITDTLMPEGQECVFAPVPEQQKLYIEKSCVQINRKIYLRVKNRYCKSTQNRTQTDPIGNTEQYSNWTLSCGPAVDTTYSNTLKEGTSYRNLTVVDEYNAKVDKYQVDYVFGEFEVTRAACTAHRDKACTSSSCTVPPCDPDPKRYCYDADSPLISYYQEYRNNPTIENWNRFIGKGSDQYNCCQPLINDPKLRDDYLDSLGNNIYKTYCVTTPVPEKVCFNEVGSYEDIYDDDKTNEENKKAYASNCCSKPEAKKEMGTEYNDLCPVPPTPTYCFTGDNPYKKQYADGKITVAQYAEKCCLAPDANTEAGMGDEYETICPSDCFNGENSLKIQYANGKITAEQYSNKCCTADGAESNEGMGPEFNTLCPQPTTYCFTGDNPYKKQYADGNITSTEYAIKCCKEFGANTEEGMGNNYEKLCPLSSCDPNVNPISCSQESDSGFIYEAGDKGITSNNKICLLNSSNDTSNQFLQFGFENNKYCRVLCKEDAELFYPGFGYNPNSKNPFLIKAGQYFKFKPYILAKIEKEFLPSVSQSRSCVVQSFPNTFAMDLSGTSDFSKFEPTGYYARAEAALKAYYNLTKLVNETSNPHYKKEYEAQRQAAAANYYNNVNKIINAIDQYNQCSSWTNQYDEEDYPKIEDFWYNEMATNNVEIAESLKKIKVQIQNQEVTNEGPEYCDEGMNICGAPLMNYSVPTFKKVSSLPVTISGSRQSFIDSLKDSSVNMGLFYVKKTNATIKIDYTLGSELYALKPTAMTTDSESPIFQSLSGKYTYNRIGYGLPVNFDTFGGKRYNYQFVLKNLGKTDGNLMKIYKAVQQDQTTTSDSIYICHYEVSNEIICPRNACPTNCADPLTCYGDDNPIPDPTLQTIFRSVSNDDINPNDRPLGSNWSDEKGMATKARIEELGNEIYAEAPQYSFVLDTNKILEIRRYNDENSYASFEMVCNQESEKCRSDFVAKYAETISENWIKYNETTKKFETEK